MSEQHTKVSHVWRERECTIVSSIGGCLGERRWRWWWCERELLHILYADFHLCMHVEREKRASEREREYEWRKSKREREWSFVTAVCAARYMCVHAWRGHKSVHVNVVGYVNNCNILCIILRIVSRFITTLQPLSPLGGPPRMRLLLLQPFLSLSLLLFTLLSNCNQLIELPAHSSHTRKELNYENPGQVQKKTISILHFRIIRCKGPLQSDRATTNCVRMQIEKMVWADENVWAREGECKAAAAAPTSYQARE